MRYTLAVIPLLLCGCANIPGLGYQGMDAQTVKEAVKDKSAGVTCTQFTGTGGAFTALSMNTDQKVVTNGSVTVKCGSAEAVFTDTGKKP
jgi:hypothetical protein